MPSEDRIHELLPWYLTETLEPDEAAAFRDHLPGCEPCREEMAVIKKIQAEVERHGEEFLEDHPPAGRLVAALRGELEDDEAAKVRRHIALCTACATEARWVRGELAARAPEVPAQRPVRGARGAWVWLGAVAALVVAFMITKPLRTPVGPSTGVVTPQFVVPTERAEGEANVFTLPPAPQRLLLMFEVDLPRESFPVGIEILDADGESAHRQSGVAPESLLQDAYLFVQCHRRDCKPGSYTASITASRGDESAPLEFRFEVLESPPPTP